MAVCWNCFAECHSVLITWYRKKINFGQSQVHMTAPGDEKCWHLQRNAIIFHLAIPTINFPYRNPNAKHDFFKVISQSEPTLEKSINATPFFLTFFYRCPWTELFFHLYRLCLAFTRTALSHFSYFFFTQFLAAPLTNWDTSLHNLFMRFLLRSLHDSSFFFFIITSMWSSIFMCHAFYLKSDDGGTVKCVKFIIYGGKIRNIGPERRWRSPQILKQGNSWNEMFLMIIQAYCQYRKTIIITIFSCRLHASLGIGLPGVFVFHDVNRFQF